MRRERLVGIQTWFESYVGGFALNGGDLPPALQIKLCHSERVAAEARGLARDLAWPASHVNAAEALGLLHDIGRFSQFSEFRTFSDSLSVNHGERGWSVAANSALISGLPGEDREPILDGIRYHNSRTIPDGITPRSLPFLKLIRDADKLDISRIVLDSVEKDGFPALLDMLPGLTLDRTCSVRVVEEVMHHRGCSIKSIRCLGDFLLMQLSWAYDMNYVASLRRLSERRIPSRIVAMLAQAPCVQTVADQVNAYISHQLDSRPASATGTGRIESSSADAMAHGS